MTLKAWLVDRLNPLILCGKMEIPKKSSSSRHFPLAGPEVGT